MAIIELVPRARAARYNGASNNSAEIISLFNEALACQGSSQYAEAGTVNSSVCEIVIKNSTSNVIESMSQVENNKWLIVNSYITTANMDDAFLGYTWRTMNDTMSLLGQTATFAAAAAASGGAMGCYASITVNGLSNANFDVPIRPRQTSGSFTAVPMLTGSSSLLGSLSITGLTSGAVGGAAKLTDANGLYDRVRINVANSGALQLAGAAILVHVTP